VSQTGAALAIISLAMMPTVIVRIVAVPIVVVVAI
jgi:hypothetical protein